MGIDVIDIASGKTLLQIHEETSKQSPGDIKRGRRQLSRRDSDEQVGRALKEHFGNFSEYEVDIRNVDGKTLRQTIRDAKSDAKSSKKKLGSSFWKSLKMKFAAVDDPCRRLHVDNPNQEVRPALVDALRLSNSSNTTIRNKQPLHDWLARASKPNQRELVGLYKAALQVNPANSTTSCNFVVAVGRFTVKHDLAVTFAPEVEVFAPHVDHALACAWAAMRKENIPMSTFWECYKETSSLVMDSAMVTKVLGATAGWKEVEAEISALTSSSQIGQKLFGFVAELLTASKLSAFVDVEIAKLMSADVTLARYHGFLECMDQEATSVQADRIVKNKREIEVKYRQVTLNVMIANFRDEVDIKVAAALKSAAVGHNLIPLLFEDSLLGKAGLTAAVTIDVAVLADYTAARKSANAMFGLEDWKNSAALTSMFKAKAPMLLPLDRSFSLEIGLVQALGGEAGAALLQDRCLQALPNEAAQRFPSLEHACQRMSVIVQSELFGFCSRPAQAPIHMVYDVLDKLDRGHSPNIDQFSSQPFLRIVQTVLPLFASCVDEEHQPGGAAKPRVLRGKVAVEMMLQRLETKHQENEELNFAMVEPVQAFKYLLTPVQNESLSTIVKHILSTTVVVKKTSIKRESQAAGSSSSSKKRKAADDDKTMDLFA